jgi:hypothetical protein
MYQIRSLNIGDAIMIYIHRCEGGASMGRGVEGIKDYERWVAFGGMIYNDHCGQGYYMDTMKPIGIPLHDNCIFGVQKGAAMDVIEIVMKETAMSVGRWAIRHYKALFHKLPFNEGCRVTIGPDYEYKKINKVLGIRNNHVVLSSKNLVMVSNPMMISNDNIITVMDSDTKKSAQVGIEAVWGIKY